MRHRRLALPLVLPLLLVLLSGRIAAQQTAAWSVAPKPLVDIGGDESDSMAYFGAIAGVTRLGTGDIVVADQKAFTVRYFNAAGKYQRSFGRHGGGPGEFGAGILRMLRCGDSLYVTDWNHMTSVFSAAGHFKRAVPWVPPRPGENPYATQCNNAGLSIAFGWERGADTRPGTFRPMVPFWISNPDGTLRVNLGMHPGSERYADMQDGHVVGSGALPLGKQAVVAIGRSRAYIGTADSFEIDVYTLDGKPAGRIFKPEADLRTTNADIQRFLMLDTLGKPAKDQVSDLKRFASGVTYPKTIPAYAAVVVDATDNLWVQRYPRSGDVASHWEVFSPAGAQIARINLPLNLQVAEVGADYVLGTWIDPDQGTEHIQEYRLNRRGP